MLGTIYQRATLYRDSAAISLHLIICTNGTSLHVEMDLHLVTLLPLAVDGIVAVLTDSAHLLAIHKNLIAKTFAVGVLIEVRGYHLVLHPAWNADLQGKLSCGILIDRHGDIPIPRVFCSLAQGDLLATNSEVAFI